MIKTNFKKIIVYGWLWIINMGWWRNYHSLIRITVRMISIFPYNPTLKLRDNLTYSKADYRHSLSSITNPFPIIIIWYVQFVNILNARFFFNCSVTTHQILNVSKSLQTSFTASLWIRQLFPDIVWFKWISTQYIRLH